MKNCHMRGPAALLSALAIAVSAAAQHGHLNVGVMDSDNSGTANAGDQLAVKNAADWVESSGYIHPSTPTNAGPIFSYYGGTANVFALTPTSLSGNSGRRAAINAATGAVTYQGWEDFGPSAQGSGPVAGATSGAFIQLRFLSVELLWGDATSFSFFGSTSSSPDATPADPTFEFTFAGLGLGSLSPVYAATTIDLTALNTRIGDGVDTSFILPVPATGTYPGGFTADQLAEGFRWNVTGDHRSTAVDPYGHIHGRSWATNGAGDFRITLEAIDVNGIQATSEPFVLRFSTVPEPATTAALGALGALVVTGWLRSRRR